MGVGCDASSSTSIPLPKTEESGAGNSIEFCECDAHAFRTRDQSKLILPTSLIPTAQTQTCQASKVGMGQSCRQEKTSRSAWPKGLQASPPKALSGVMMTMDNRPRVKQNPLADSFCSR